MDDLTRKVVRLAYEKPEFRGALLPLIKEASGKTLTNMLGEAKRTATAQFMKDVVAGLNWVAKGQIEPGYKVRSKGTLPHRVTLTGKTFGFVPKSGPTQDSEDLEITLTLYVTKVDAVFECFSHLGGKKRKTKIEPLSMDGQMVASHAFYEHLEGLVP